MLEDFQTDTATMARKRHLASTARGLFGFCLMTLVTTGLIRPIRGRKKSIERVYISILSCFFVLQHTAAMGL